jgi:hypothetical protein
MVLMANPRKKPVNKKKQVDTHKPSRMVRIAEALAVALEECATEDLNTLTDQVRAACFAYAVKRGKFQKPVGYTD